MRVLHGLAQAGRALAALKFTERGAVQVVLRGEGGTLQIEVRDTGIGVAEEKLPVIFEMFRQVGAPSQSGHNGVGLGLYIVDQLVRRLGGRIEVASTLGRGTSFVVHLPGFQDAEHVPVDVGASGAPGRPRSCR